MDTRLRDTQLLLSFVFLAEMEGKIKIHGTFNFLKKSFQKLSLTLVLLFTGGKKSGGTIYHNNSGRDIIIRYIPKSFSFTLE